MGTIKKRRMYRKYTMYNLYTLKTSNVKWGHMYKNYTFF